MKGIVLVLSFVVAGAFHLAGNERLPRPEYPEPQFQRAD